MKRSRFTEEQIIAMIKEQEAGSPTTDVCRKYGISSASFYKYKAKFGGMDVSDARKLRALEEENSKLKKLLAETKPDAVAVSKQMDVVLDLENRLKKKQLSTLVAIKNVLTESQQASLKATKNWVIYGNSTKIPSTLESNSPQFRVGVPFQIDSEREGSVEPVKGISSTVSPSGDVVITPGSKSTIYFQVDPKNGENKPTYYLKTKKGYEEFFDGDNLNPDEIQSIEVLKGETATTRFGEKAKNGAIVITLKKEKE